MRIAVDVMGGDHGSGVVIEGVRRALQTTKKISALYLVGNEAEISAAMASTRWRDHRVHVIHASQVLTMEDKPIAGLRKKKDCSIARAVDLIKEGKAEALISPGNTGAVVAAATIKLRPLPGVDRPGIAAVIPAPENEFVLLDAGANVPFVIVMLTGYFASLYRLYDLRRRNASQQEMASEARINPYFLKEYLDALARYPVHEIERAFEILVGADEQSKTSAADPRQVMQIVLIQLLAPPDSVTA